MSLPADFPDHDVMRSLAAIVRGPALSLTDDNETGVQVSPDCWVPVPDLHLAVLSEKGWISFSADDDEHGFPRDLLVTDDGLYWLKRYCTHHKKRFAVL